MKINGAGIPTAGATLPSDRNDMRRKAYFTACMKLEGWENKNQVTGLLAFLFNSRGINDAGQKLKRRDRARFSALPGKNEPALKIR
ncbi:hypothetical protein BHU62_16305 [Serratia marcescens]|uniref:Uncharacterized protein n=2 Tax=Serratia marcescens TaxID=615 RepID=A0A1Q4NXQ1_SERMA|nr:hypothetical protein BHU62_16305 [Serratia marcescens]